MGQSDYLGSTPASRGPHHGFKAREGHGHVQGSGPWALCKPLIVLCVGVILCLLPAAAANLDIEAFTSKPNADGTVDYSVPMQVVILMTMLSFVPGIIMMMTSFARIVIVISILRQAIGLQSSPSNQIVTGIALFLTLFIMTPVLDQTYTEAIEPYLNDEIEAREAFERGQRPIKQFMLEQTRVSDLIHFSEYANITAETPQDLPLRVVIPAFIISELKTAFQIGFMVFLPFLIIDLVVASILMAMGMMMLSPMIVAMPFKLMIFVLVDGWSLIMGTLVQSYGLGIPA